MFRALVYLEPELTLLQLYILCCVLVSGIWGFSDTRFSIFRVG